MSSEGEHGQIIAAAARAALVPLGFRRKGRSRVWYADRGFWLSVVEFQPSGFCKGSYLNVGVHWFWGPQDFLSIHYTDAGRRTFIEFTGVEQFKPLAEQQAASAADASTAFCARFKTIEDTARTLASDSEQLTLLTGQAGGWPDFHAAIALGLAGEVVAARALLRAVIKSFEGWPAMLEPVVKYEALLGDPVGFRAAAENQINRKRQMHGMSRLAEIF